jgi:hypothetical protein
MERLCHDPRARRALAAIVVVLCLPAIAGAQSVAIVGLTGPPVTLTADDLRAIPHRTVRATIHGLSGVYGGVPLTLLLARVNAPRGETLRGPAISDILLVKACDGYRIALTLADVDPAFRDQAVILADSVDGHPLAAPEGPFRLIVEGDKRAARSARCVTSLTLMAVP